MGFFDRKSIQSGLNKKIQTDRFGNKVIDIPNSRLDFKGEFQFQGVSKSGRSVRLGQNIMSGPSGKKFRNVRGTIRNRNNKRQLSVMNDSFILDF